MHDSGASRLHLLLPQEARLSAGFLLLQCPGFRPPLALLTDVTPWPLWLGVRRDVL